MVPNLVMMPAASNVFSGFLTAKLPFSLLPRFKLEVTSLDVYVSSLWTAHAVHGLRGMMMLILTNQGGRRERDDGDDPKVLIGGEGARGVTAPPLPVSAVRTGLSGMNSPSDNSGCSTCRPVDLELWLLCL